MGDLDQLTNDEIAALERLEDDATVMDEHVVILRYEHGGGRVYRDGLAGRKLIADFYKEGDREAWIAARTALPRLLAEVRRHREG